MQFEFLSNSHEPDRNKAVGDFVSRGIWGEPGRFGDFCSLEVSEGGQTAAGVVYHNFYPDAATIEVSSYSRTPKWLTRAVLRAFLSMPFEKLGCQAILARHDSRNLSLRRQWARVGAVEYLIPRLRGKFAPPEAVTVLTDDAWFSSPFMQERVLVHG